MTINNSNVIKSSKTIDEKRIDLVTKIEIALDESGYEWEMAYDPNEDTYYFKIASTRETQNN